MPATFRCVLTVASVLLAETVLVGLPALAAEADWIIKARYVLPMDSSHRVIENGAVAIRGMRIAAVGTQAEIARQFQAENVLDRGNAIVMPGLVDTHTHAPMSLLRGIADDRKLQDWLQKFIFPAEARNVNAEFVKWGTRLACLEMLQSGITTYTDMYYFEDVEAETAKEAGVRGVLGQTVIGFPAPDYKTWQAAISGADEFMTKFAHDELITPAVAPHAIYTTPDDALMAARQLATRRGKPLLIHLSETQTERDQAIQSRGMTPTRTLEKLGVLEGRVVAAHSIWESDEDLQILKKHGTGVAHCPSSNTKLASGIARVTAMVGLGIPVGFGTDGFAGSNDTADLFGEMNLAAKLQKVTTNDPTVLASDQTTEMATMGGARVLGLGREIGSLEAGKRADVITVSLDRANAHPLYSPFSYLAYAVKAGDVEDVFINGRLVMRSRQVLTLNAQEIYRKADDYRRQVSASLQ